MRGFMADFPPPKGKGVGFLSVQIKGAIHSMFSHVPCQPDETCPAEAWTFRTSRLRVMFNKFCALNVFEGCFSVKLFGMDGLRAFSHALDQILEPITSFLTVPWEHKIGLNEQSDILCPKTALQNDLGQTSHFTDEETFCPESFSMGTRPAALCFPVRGGVCCWLTDYSLV